MLRSPDSVMVKLNHTRTQGADSQAGPSPSLTPASGPAPTDQHTASTRRCQPLPPTQAPAQEECSLTLPVGALVSRPWQERGRLSQQEAGRGSSCPPTNRGVARVLEGAAHSPPLTLRETLLVLHAGPVNPCRPDWGRAW